jgi:hypothetical protein
MSVIAVTDLPEPDSPDDGEDLTGVQLERDVVDGVDDAVLGAEVDLQALDGEQRCAGAHDRRIRGSSTA